MTGRGYRGAGGRPSIRGSAAPQGEGFFILIPSRSRRDRIEGRLAAGKPAAVQDALPRTVAMKLR